MADVLKKLGYRVAPRPNVNYAGMEIDIEGASIVGGTPLYAECKCYEEAVSSPKVQAFFGKYMSRWLKSKKSVGLFIAIPGVNPHARGFVNENFESVEMTCRLYEEPEILSLVQEAGWVRKPDQIKPNLPLELGTYGDSTLFFSEHGYWWAFNVITSDSAVANAYILTDQRGISVTSEALLEFFTERAPEFAELEYLPKPIQNTERALLIQAPEDEEIVPVRGGSGWFEYQFPASPEHFVGRKHALAAVKNFATEIVEGTTSSRALLFEANSGWGKSSTVLASVAALREAGHEAVAIDCRSIASSLSVLKSIDYALKAFASSGPASQPLRLTGFEGVTKTLAEYGAKLAAEKRCAFVFFDQFENIFFIPEALKKLRDLLLFLCTDGTNIAFGFSWKTDLVGTTTDFPYKLRDAIVSVSRLVELTRFSDVETNALLVQLQKELRSELRRDVKFLLSEYSQGYPWLLKKLCAHVKTQRDEGVSRSDIAERLLNIQELFEDDLHGLTSAQEEFLRRIAKLAPVSVSELGEHVDAEVVQSLVDRRLVVRVANKHDIYWDIFRDFLNTGKTPVQDNYIIRAQVKTAVRATRNLIHGGGSLTVAEFAEKIGFTAKVAFNLLRDMRLIGLCEVSKGSVRLLPTIPRGQADPEIVSNLRPYLKERILRNRTVF